MSSHQAEQWKRLFQQKRQNLLEEECGEALEVENFEDLQKCLQEMTAAYSRRTLPMAFERLNPGLRHIKSFASAIDSAAQYTPISCLVWGSVQAVLKCACDHTNVLDEVLSVFADLNVSVPMFENYLVLFPECPELHYPLQDLFDVYLDFCLDTIAYMKRSDSINFLSFFWTSKPTTLLQETREKIQKHFTEFKQAVEYAHRRKVHRQHLAIERTLATSPLAMPEDQINSEGEVKFPISTVNLFRNYSFRGREDTLKQMREIFNARSVPVTPLISSASSTTKTDEADESPRCCVLHGLGGIGKTQTALEYTYRNRNAYDAIFWVQAEQSTTLVTTYALIAEKLDLAKDTKGQEGQGQGRAIKRVLEWLQTTSRKWLIVFDNVEDINDLNPYLPTKTNVHGSVIITTQHAFSVQITRIWEMIGVENFDRQEGSKLLFEYLKRQPHDEKEIEVGAEISDILGGLPLAIATIGGYVHESGCAIADFLKDMQTSSNAWEAGKLGPVKQYEKSLETVFEIALLELPPSAKSFIQILAFLNPDYIPEEIFISADGKHPSYKRPALIENIRVLKRRQLIRRDTSGPQAFLSIHRTVQWNVLLDLSKDYDHRWKVFKDAFELLRRQLPEVSGTDNPEPGEWSRFEKYVPQVLSLRTHCLWPEPPVELPEAFVEVLSDMATFMWHAGLMAQGYIALTTAENILDDRNVPKENPLRGNIHEHIGIIASFNGVSQRKECMRRRHLAREARQAAHANIPNGKITREDEIRLYNVESDMAFGLMQEEDFEGSEKCIEKCHDQYRKWGTPDDIPFEYLKYHHIISYVRMSQHRPVEAIESAKLAAKLGEQCAGVEHPMTQLCRFSLANHLYLAGELKQALGLSLSVLHARSKICGEYNPFTMESHLMCGFLLLESDELVEAEIHLLACLDRRKRSVWNPEGVARAHYIYSQILTRLGNEEEAERQLQIALKTRDHYLRHFQEYVKYDPNDMAVFDQMVCLWGGRFNGKLAQPNFEA